MGHDLNDHCHYGVTNVLYDCEVPHDDHHHDDVTIKQIKKLLNDNKYYQQSGENALHFIESNLGATNKVMQYIQLKGVLKN